MNYTIGATLFVEPLMGSNPENGTWVQVTRYDGDRPMVMAVNSDKETNPSQEYPVDMIRNEIAVGYRQKIYANVEAYQAYLDELKAIAEHNNYINKSA